MKTAFWFAAVAAAGSVLASCAGTPAIEPPDGEPYVRGAISSIEHRAAGSGIRVEASPESREPCGIVATADASTRYLVRTPPGELEEASVAQLAVGDSVDVYVSGPVAESCPVQGYAAVIVRFGP
jgi:hypothetical protein